ncbi:hypothetical protein, partial [Nocardioides sp.]|uniref:COG1470 family protein n=1 Tax=Nocardioides sp. TaxID=35761 RepID=UPI0027338DDA
MGDMHVEVGERRVEARPGGAVPVVLTVSNSRDVIAGYAVRVLGADPGWVELTDSDLSLFPDESRVVTALVTVPMGVPAGERRVAVQVRELTSPEHTTIEEIVLVVPEDSSAQVRLDPAVATAGSRARFGLLVDNNGNTTLSGVLVGADPESKVRFRFDPPNLTLQPGEHAVVDLTATSRRPLAGSPVVRPLEVHLVDPPEVAGAETIAGPTGDQRRGRRRGGSTVPIPSDNQPVATGSFVQRARL